MDTSKIKKYAQDFWEDVRSGKIIIDNRTPKNVAEELAVYILFHSFIDDIVMPIVFERINLIAKYKLIMRY
jgi:hypothetical protein